MSFLNKIFKKRKFGQDLLLALDIGTDTVKALIFQINPEKETATILGVGRQKQKNNIQSGAITDVKELVGDCQKAIDQAVKMAGSRPRQTIIGVAGGLIKGSTNTIRYQREDPEAKIDLPELKNIIQKAQWKAFDKIKSELAWETGHSETEIRLINAAIVDFRIDNYQITNPLGFKGREVSIGIFNTYAPLVHLGAVQTIASEMELDLIDITSGPYALSRCLEMAESVDFKAIFIDIGGTITDLAIVRDGGINGMRMFTLGGQTFTNKISQELGVGPEEAEEIKLSYSAGSLGSRVIGKIRRILKPVLVTWISGVEMALNDFPGVDLLPSKIFICGGGSLLPGIKNSLSRSDWIKDLPLAKKIDVDFIKAKDLTSIIDKTGELNSSADISPMAIANLALVLAKEEEVLSEILRRTLRIVQE